MSYIYINKMFSKLWIDHVFNTASDSFINSMPKLVYRNKFDNCITILKYKLNCFPALLIPTIEWGVQENIQTLNKNFCIFLRFQNENKNRLVHLYIKFDLYGSWDISFTICSPGLIDSTLTSGPTNHLFFENEVIRNQSWKDFQAYLTEFLQFDEELL